MKRKGRKSASKRDDSVENGVDDKVENGDSSHDEEQEPTDKKRASKRKSTPSSAKSRENGDAMDDDDSSNEDEPLTKKGRGRPPVKDTNDEDDSEEDPLATDKKKRGRPPKSSNKDVSDIEEEEAEKTKKKSPKKKGAASKTNEDDSNEDYEVQSILDDKMIRGVKHYLIRWKGYEPESDTWEPESTLNCPELIEEYKSQQKKKKEKKAKSSTEVGWNENDDFEVDRIVDVYFKKNGKREFLVSWKGYPSSDNSWEPEENMDCKDLIEKFMSKVERARKVDNRELRTARPVTDRFTLTMYEGAGRRASRRNQGKQRVHYYDAE